MGYLSLSPLWTSSLRIMDILNELLIALIFGSYLFTAGTFIWLSDKIEKLVENHLKHLNVEIEEIKKDLYGKRSR